MRNSYLIKSHATTADKEANIPIKNAFLSLAVMETKIIQKTISIFEVCLIKCVMGSMWRMTHATLFAQSLMEAGVTQALLRIRKGLILLV
jgi:hypothetical protein